MAVSKRLVDYADAELLGELERRGNKIYQAIETAPCPTCKDQLSFSGCKNCGGSGVIVKQVENCVTIHLKS